MKSKKPGSSLSGKREQGKVFVVAGPLGNLEDITARAVRVLREVDYIACEDTRRTRKLLSALGISGKKLISHYQPKEEQVIPRLIEILEKGEDIALVTDSGTPGISDPGYRLVRAAREAGFQVTPVPGPSALTAAVSASGLPTDRISFIGFLPRKKAEREKLLEELKDRPDTLVLFESPRRAARLVKEALAILGDREAVLCREMTKLHEEFKRGSLREISESIEDEELLGEVTLLIAGALKKARIPEERELESLLEEELASGSLPLSELAARVARATGLPRKKVYEAALRLKRKMNRG